METESSEHGSRQTTRTQWHRILGAFLELLLTGVGIVVQSEVQVMSDPPKVDILLLRRDGSHWTAEQLRWLSDGLQNTLARYLLIEFKYVESLSEDALLQALAYYYFFRTVQGLSESEIQTFVMVARTPRTTLLERYGYVANSDLPGVYRSQQSLVSKVQLIVLNQLRPSDHNAFVQCFASRRRVYLSAFERIQQFGHEQLAESLWEMVAGLRSQRDQKGGMTMENKPQEGLTAEKLIQIGKEARKFVLATASTEERLAGLAPEERLAGLAPEERLAGLAPEEMARLMEQIEKYLSQELPSGK